MLKLELLVIYLKIVRFHKQYNTIGSIGLESMFDTYIPTRRLFYLFLFDLRSFDFYFWNFTL